MIFERDTLDQWERYFSSAKRPSRLVLWFVVALVLHVFGALLLTTISSKDILDAQTPAKKNPISVRLKGAETLSSPPRPSKSQPPTASDRAQRMERPRLKHPAPRPLVTDNPQAKNKIVVEKPVEAPKAEPTKEALSVGPQLISPKFRSLLPNSNLAYSNFQQSLGQKANDDIVGEDGGDGSAPVDINTREYKYVSYFDGMIRQIENVWVYPQEALRAGMQGQAIYDIVINRDGSLKKVVGVTSSGFLPLDREIERAVQSAGPFNPIPERIKQDPLVVRVRFTYTLTRFGIF